MKCRFNYQTKKFYSGRALQLENVPADEHLRHQVLALPGKCLSASQPVMLAKLSKDFVEVGLQGLGVAGI